MSVKQTITKRTSRWMVACASVVLAMLVLGSCQNDIIEESDSPVIGFESADVVRATRNSGEMITSSDVNTITVDGNTMLVWAWKTTSTGTMSLFNPNVVVQYNSQSTSNSTLWDYSPARFWDNHASYEFYAVAPAKDNKNTPETIPWALSTDGRKFSVEGVPAVQVLEDHNGGSKIKLFTAGNSETGTKSSAVDYLVASSVSCPLGQKGNENDGIVRYTFHHILSKLTVNVLTTSAFATGSYPKIELTDLSINLAGMCPTFAQKTTGVLTPASTNGDTWSGTAMTPRDFVCFDKDGITVTSDLPLTTSAQKLAAYLVAPTATGTTSPAQDAATCAVGVNVTYKVYYSATDIQQIAATATVPSDQIDKFVQETEYVLNVKIDPQTVTFNVKINDYWYAGSTQSIPFE